jgi:predicted aldo/keto reductase-like oxidoreductase
VGVKYRTLGNTGQRVSALGFGAMRLPTKGKETDVDEAQAIEMLRYAIDRGVDYVDTAYVYHGGNSEVVLGKALKDGYRERVRLATKLPIWSVTQQADCGRIGKFGFSFHDTYDAFVEILNDYDWPFCQIQYNFVNEDVQAGTKGLHYAAAKGLGVIVMEPLFGGTLATPPQPIWEIWNRNQHKHRPADVALRWLWDKPEVSLVLSGMSSLEQVEQNIESACRSGVGWLDENEAALVSQVQQEYRKLSPIPCSKCGYCVPCPNGVNIPVNFELYNNAAVFKGSSLVLCRNLYNSLPETERAGTCAECGRCQEKCPQGIEIGKMMRRVEEQFR